MILKFDTNQNEKQKLCAQHWIDKETIDIVYGGAKGCFSKDTKVLTDSGYKPIQNVLVNDYVLSLNTISGFLESKIVVNTFCYGGANNNKMITFELDNNLKITCTDDHRFYFNRNWIEARELAKRKMALHPKFKKEILNIQQRQAINNGLERIENGKNNEASNEPSGVYEHHISYKWEKQECEDSQISSQSISNKTGKSYSSKPYRFQSIKQRIGEFRMGDCSRKHSTLIEGRKISRIQERMQAEESITRGEGAQFQANRERCFGDKSEIQTEKIYKRNVRKGIRSRTLHNKRCNSTEVVEAFEINLNEIISITEYNSTECVYDIEVKDNHNFLITENNYIVHNSGKSYIGVSLIFGDAFIYPGTHYFIARKTLNDLRKFTRPSIHEVFNHWGITEKYYKFNGQDSYYELYNGSKVFLIDAKYMPSDPDFQRFGSMQMTRGWIEEAGEFEESAKNNLQASIGRWKNEKYNLTSKLLQTCNPSKNYLYRDYYKPSKDGNLPYWRKFIQALPDDNKMLPKIYIDNLMKILSPNEVERLLKGNWEYDDNPYKLFEYEDILNLFSNEFVYKPEDEKYLTCDIAYEGSDLFVIGYWEGLTLKEIWAIDKIDEVLVSKKIHDVRIEKGVKVSNVVYDADGLKTFVRQSTKTGYLQGAKEFHNGGKPIKVRGKLENFKNLKAQCYFYLAEYAKDAKIYLAVKVHRKQIIEDLEQINKLPLADDGKIALERKKDLKDRLGRSPDFGDMLMMRMYFELKPKNIKLTTELTPREMGVNY